MDDLDRSMHEFRLAEQVRRSAVDWLKAFETALVSRDAARVGALFHEDSHWQDVLAFTWHLDPVCEVMGQVVACDWDGRGGAA